MMAWRCIHRGEPTGETFACGCDVNPDHLEPVYACNFAPLLIGKCAVRIGHSKHRPHFKQQFPSGLLCCTDCNFREEPDKATMKRPASRPARRTDSGGLTVKERQLARINERREAAKAARLAAMQAMPAGESPAGASEVAARHRARLAPSEEKLVYVTSQQMIADTVNLLLPQLPPNLSVVAGVPRSGMAAAGILATHLQLPLATVRGGKLYDVGEGSRGRNGWAGDRNGKALIVDDSVYGGGNMRRIRQQFGAEALLAAIYVRPEVTGTVDFYGRSLPSPHLFQWNMLNGAPLVGRTINPILHGGMALDFDGVICVDPDVSDRDEDRYLEWLHNAVPLNLPRRHPVPLIVTFRLEKFREATLAWLARWQIRVDRLVMHPATSHAERVFNVAEHKGRTFRDSPCRLFVESSTQQARIIHRESGKPVLDLSSGIILQ
jgi:orotate phosphoribosyltransferase